MDVGAAATPAQKVVFLAVGMATLILPALGIPFAVKWAGSGLHKIHGGIQNALGKVGRSTGGAATKLAQRSPQGTAIRGMLADRKAVREARGRDWKRQMYEKNPKTAALFLGGAGGKTEANRIMDTEARRHRAEKVDELRKGLTANVSNALATNEDVQASMARGTWKSGRAVSAEDRAAYTKLQQQGYVDPVTGHVRRDPILATSAMHSIMDAEIATDENIRGVSRLLAGASDEENADFSESLRTAAAAHKYKNFSGATVNNGVLSKFYAKTGELEPDFDPSNNASVAANRAAQVKGARKVIESGGLRDINKDAVTKDMDPIFLEAIQEMYNEPGITVDQQKQLILQVAEQTKHIDKGAVTSEIVSRLESPAPATAPPGSPPVRLISEQEFKDVQRSIKSGGATPMPPGW